MEKNFGIVLPLMGGTQNSNLFFEKFKALLFNFIVGINLLFLLLFILTCIYYVDKNRKIQNLKIKITRK